MKEIIKNQILAALETLNQSIQNCSIEYWEQSHNDAPFSQVVFHVLFYTDYYLSADVHEFKTQKFHKENPGIFRDYEELEYKEPQETYTREEICSYLNFCHKKINDYFEKINNDDLFADSPHKKDKKLKTIELLISSVIRHLQHHAAQLGLRVQQTSGKMLNWTETGWNKSTTPP